ncbi:hypothetical protein ABK040_012850 [Willaertia magna]
MIGKIFTGKLKDRSGFNFFYDRHFTNTKSPKSKIFIFLSIFFIINYYPGKFIYRYIYEHPYWERKQMNKDRENEINNLLLNLSNSERREMFKSYEREYYLNKNNLTFDDIKVNKVIQDIFNDKYFNPTPFDKLR